MNFKIIQLNFNPKLFILFCLLFNFISTSNGQEDQNNQTKGVPNTVIEFPTIDSSGSSVAFSCPATGTYTEVNIYPSFFSQVGTFFPIVGLLITVAVYGTTSIFGYMTTCLLDDIVILGSSFLLIFTWYTTVKPLWMWVLATMLNDYINDPNNNNDYRQYIKILGGIFVASATITLIALGSIRYEFHKYRAYFSEVKKVKEENKNQENRNCCFGGAKTEKDYARRKRYFCHVKTAIIWLYFFHSLEIMVYSAIQYKYVFSVLLKIHLQQQADSGVVDVTEKRSSANLLTLNYLLKLLYFTSSTVLVSTYHFPNLEKRFIFWYEILRRRENFNAKWETYKKKNQRKWQYFIRKRTFFITVILSLLQIFFEYYWFCTPSIISTIFNTILTTVLTRAIKSFFSNEGIVKYIHKGINGEVSEENKEVMKANVYAQIKISDIFNIRRFSINNSDISNVLDPNPDHLEKYKVSKVRGHSFVTKKVTQPKKKQYYYPLPVDDSIFLIEFELGEKKVTDDDDANNDTKIDVNDTNNKDEKTKKRIKKKQIYNAIEKVKEDLLIGKIGFYAIENGTLPIVQNEAKKIKKVNGSNDNEKLDTTESHDKTENAPQVISVPIFTPDPTDNKQVTTKTDDGKDGTTGSDNNKTENKTMPDTPGNNQDEKISIDTKDAKKAPSRKYMKIDGYVLINILETGFLNYIIYSHRSTGKQEEQKKPVQDK